MELMIIGVVAVLLFGSKLPSVARSLGKSMSEFKKGMQDLQNEFHQADSRPAQVRRYHEIDDREEATAPKFEPPASEPALEVPRNETPVTVPPDAADKPFDAAP
ncbi:MAG: twin-arginine translocase TatA/TatE family subunit [Pirellulales bacterium]